MPRLRSVVLTAVSLAIGIVIGGNVFTRTQPRSLIALHPCTNCLSPQEFAGLLASVGIQQLPGLVPLKALETDKTIAIRVPARTGVHYVLFPKRDFKDIGEFSAASAPYVVDLFTVARVLIERDHLTSYELRTNGPGFQSVRYLHFHIEGK